jgi:hypothetical protein
VAIERGVGVQVGAPWQAAHRQTLDINCAFQKPAPNELAVVPLPSHGSPSAGVSGSLRGCLVPKNFHPKTSHRILRHMHGVLNVDETKN